MIQDSYREVAIGDAKQNEKIIDAMTNKFPILASMPMIATNAGVKHKFEKLVDASTLSEADFDDAMTKLEMTTKIEEASLGLYSGSLEVGEDKLRVLGTTASSYFSKKIPKYYELTMMALEKQAFDVNLRKFAKAKGKQVNIGATGDVFTMYVVNWEQDELGLLYDPAGFGNGRVFDEKAISGGQLIELSTGATGFKARVKFELGLLFGNERYVATVDNWNADKLPTELDIDNAIADVRPVKGRTFIYMSPYAKNLLNKFKSSALQMGVYDKDFDATIDTWNGIPIITSHNLTKNSVL